MIGRPATGNNGLGISKDSGRKRVPFNEMIDVKQFTVPFNAGYYLFVVLQLK